jgi:hypothetical protein
VALEQECLGAVALIERQFAPGDGGRAGALRALRARAALLPFGDDARQLLGGCACSRGFSRRRAGRR